MRRGLCGSSNPHDGAVTVIVTSVRLNWIKARYD
jgi:hypothetical protein